MRTLKTACVALLVALLPMAGAGATDVTLKMKGGTFEVHGALKAFDGQKYVLETKDFGNLTLDAARFDCVGAGCSAKDSLPATPQDRLIAGKPDQILLSANEHFAQGLLPSLIASYAQKLGATSAPALQAHATTARLELLDAQGLELANFDVSRAGSGDGIAGLIAGTTHIALSDRGFSTDEVQKLTAAQPRFRARDHELLLGVDTLAVVVHPTLPVDTLTLDTVARILSGAVTDWSELGLPKGPIHIHVRPGGGSDAFTEQALKPRNLALSSAVVPHSAEAEVAASVARDPLAIGVTSLSTVRGVKAVGIDMGCGVVQWPSSFAVKSGDYPFARRLYLLTSGAALPPAARGFLRHMAMADVHGTMEAMGFGHRSVEPMGARDLVRRIAEIVSAPPKAFDLKLINELQNDLKTFQRTSITLRFLPGGNDLDPRSRLELQRLVELLNEPAHASKALIVAGFANAGGPMDQAVAASLKRAAQVRLQILQALGQARTPQRQIAAKGFGHIAPLACIDGADGALQNRRVEIWWRD